VEALPPADFRRTSLKARGDLRFAPPPSFAAMQCRHVGGPAGVNGLLSAFLWVALSMPALVCTAFHCPRHAPSFANRRVPLAEWMINPTVRECAP